MADFSYLAKLWPASLGKAHAEGRETDDDSYVTSYNTIDPRLLSPSDEAALFRILQPRRGRPPKGSPSRSQLAARVLEIRRPDVPPLFLRALADRILSKTGFLSPGAYARLARKERETRNLFISWLYKQFQELQDGSASVELPVLGRVEVPLDLPTRSERSLAMAQTVLRERLGIDCPSIPRMRNILWERRRKMWG